jgi:hypothetical protein
MGTDIAGAAWDELCRKKKAKRLIKIEEIIKSHTPEEAAKCLEYYIYHHYDAEDILP